MWSADPNRVIKKNSNGPEENIESTIYTFSPPVNHDMPKLECGSRC